MTRSHACSNLVLAAGLALAALFSVPQRSAAQPLQAIRDQIQINQVTVGFQQVPDVDRAASGASVVVWESYGSAGGDADGRSIQARRYLLTGTPNSDQFQVNTQAVNEQVAPKVSVAPDGRFAIVWQSNEGGGGPANQDIRARVYSSSGAPLGPDFLVNTFTTGDQRSPDVAWGGNGGFAVVWESDDDPTGPGVEWNIVVRLYNASGAPLTGEFLVNTLAGQQLDPAIAGHSSGDFAVAWESSTSSGSDSTTQSIQLRVLGGNPETQVNDHTPDVADDNPAIAVSAAGDILVAWESWGTAGDDSNRISIQGRIYGDTISPVFQANGYTVDDQRFPSAAFLPDGRGVIAWQSYGSSSNDASEYSVQIRGFSLSGTPLGSDVQANSYTTNNQRFPALATDGPGDILLVWESFGSHGGDASGPSIQARRLSLDLLLLGTFDSGNFAGWSFVQP